MISSARSSSDDERSRASSRRLLRLRQRFLECRVEAAIRVGRQTAAVVALLEAGAAEARLSRESEAIRTEWWWNIPEVTIPLHAEGLRACDDLQLRTIRNPVFAGDLRPHFCIPRASTLFAKQA